MIAHASPDRSGVGGEQDGSEMGALFGRYPGYEAVVARRGRGVRTVRSLLAATSSETATLPPPFESPEELLSARPYGEGGRLTRVVRPIAARGTARVGHSAYARTVTAAGRMRGASKRLPAPADPA